MAVVYRSHPGDDDSPTGPATLRLWLSDQQWLAVLTRIERAAAAYDGPEQRDRRYAVRTQCIVRVQQADDRSATYLVRTHNISCGGLGFIHDAPIAPGTRSTVGLEAPDGAGLIVAAHVAWSRQIQGIDPDPYEIGLRFDQAINVGPFTGEPR